jgi:hypothetical protein
LLKLKAKFFFIFLKIHIAYHISKKKSRIHIFRLERKKLAKDWLNSKKYLKTKKLQNSKKTEKTFEFIFLGCFR